MDEYLKCRSVRDYRVWRAGGEAALALIEATGQAAFFKNMAKGQLEIIAKRKADGSFYPELVEDLELYQREQKRWEKIAAQYRKAAA